VKRGEVGGAGYEVASVEFEIPPAEFKPGPEDFTVESVSDLEPDEHRLPLMDIVMEGIPAPLKDLHEIAQVISSGTLLPRGGTVTP
jgi:hypothetical protein